VPVTGRLPVSVPPYLSIGSGLRRDSLRVAGR